MSDLKRHNEQVLASGQKVAYVMSDNNIIIRKVNNQQITPDWFEYIKRGGQEVIAPVGDTEFTLSFYHLGGISGVVKVISKVREEKVSFTLEAGKAYVIFFQRIMSFLLKLWHLKK